MPSLLCPRNEGCNYPPMGSNRQILRYSRFWELCHVPTLPRRVLYRNSIYIQKSLYLYIVWLPMHRSQLINIYLNKLCWSWKFIPIRTLKEISVFLSLPQLRKSSYTPDSNPLEKQNVLTWLLIINTRKSYSVSFKTTSISPPMIKNVIRQMEVQTKKHTNTI